jgi:hypothetical protein
MPGQEAREDLDEFFFMNRIGSHETVADVETMGPLAAIQPDPVARPPCSHLVKPFAVLGDPRFDLFKGKVLRMRDGRKKQCGCQDYR